MARVLQSRHILELRRLGLRQLCLVRPRIDQRQLVAGTDALSLLEVEAEELAVDARLDRDGIQRVHIA